MATPGPTNSITDIEGLSVGEAQDSAVDTGVSVIVCDRPASAAVAVAGGGPGTRETDLLRAGMLVQKVDAIVLSGGSAYGLAAADGVAGELGAAGRGFALMDQPGVPPTPIVPSAILYDLANGGDKDWGSQPPYARLGRAAFQAAGDKVGLGRAGAGFGARAGSRPGGQGTASIQSADGLGIGALVAVNCFGSVTLPGTDCFWAWPYEIAGEFGGRRPPPDYRTDPDDWGAAKFNPAAGMNTTIACLATNAALTASDAQRVADMALAGLARAIRPVFSPVDGDTVFVISTSGPAGGTDPLTLTRLGELAASTLARAIARGVWQAGLSSA
ncbi:MAG: peptidase T4 [Alphaproteobacteria bacterium]|jgi:L-aminopeptidase/D-esterase-like protein|nr:peptidase T4 [Alphaproteobacteria bacterium]